MSRFARINEDPSYDDDGNWVAEDDWATAPIDIDDSELDEPEIEVSHSPRDTLNKEHE